MPRDTVSVRRIWVTLALSVLIHALLMWRVQPHIRTPASDEKTIRDAKGQLSVQLVPRRSAPPAPQPPPVPRVAPAPRPKIAQAPPKAAPRPRIAEAPPPPRPPPREPPPKPAVRAEPKPPVLAVEKPAPLPAPTPERAAPRPPDTADFASYVESRRRARSETPPPPPAREAPPSAPPQEDANARANRIAAANLGTNAKPSYGADARRGGGVFTIQRVTYDYAEFLFFGWNKDIRRNTQQLIEVRKGNNSDIRIAVVRRMIAIIRDHEQGDFIWESPRLGRNVTLSARQRDNAGLEAFMMREFFEDDRRAVPGAPGR